MNKVFYFILMGIFILNLIFTDNISAICGWICAIIGESKWYYAQKKLDKLNHN